MAGTKTRVIQPRLSCAAISREELAWAAGFVEGEGSFSCGNPSSGKSHGYLRIDVSQVDRVPLERLQAMFGGSIYYRERPKSPLGKKPHHELVIQRFENVQFAVAAMWPWLDDFVKAKAVKAITSYLALQPTPRPVPAIQAETRREYQREYMRKYRQGWRARVA